MQYVIAILALVIACESRAQEPENPPTLKLDRVPLLPAVAGQTKAPAAPASTYTVEVLVDGLSGPWALAFLPNGEMLISENAGGLRLLDENRLLSAPLAGMPDVSHEGWAGLFDVLVDPDFQKNHLFYFSYTAPSGNAEFPNVPRVARARLDRAALRVDDIEVLLDGNAWQEMQFAADGTLLVSGATSAGGNEQELSSHAGKLLRVNADGSIPKDNPWAADGHVPAAIYSYGHRDISGIAIHPGTGEVWISEHGPRGGDEINIVHAGANYGWPVISYGRDYSGDPVGTGLAQQTGMQQPQYFWTPSIAPSGLLFYTGAMFGEWRGNIFVSALSGQHIARLVLDGDRVVAEERLLLDRSQRIRELRQGPDGALYALTEEESGAPAGHAQLLRIYR